MDNTNMMASRVLSRFLPVAEGDVSFYDGARREDARRADVEAQRHTYDDFDRFHDDEDNPEAFLLDGEQPTPTDPGQSPEARSPLAMHSRPKAHSASAKRRRVEEEDVPASLLLEPRRKAGPIELVATRQMERKHAKADEQWKTAQEGLYASRAPRSSRQPSRPSRAVVEGAPSHKANLEADAMWLFTNAPSLDSFLLEVYHYYVEHGVWSILLSRALESLTQLFVFSFAIFLTTCVDYSSIPGSKSSKDVVIPKCMSKASWFKNATLFFFVLYWLYKQITYARDIRRLFRMHDFYLHVLGISDQDIQTVSWKRVVDGLVKVQNAHVSTASNPLSDKARKYVDYGKPQQRLNAESIANRLMRQDNYYVAMYNKDLLDFTLPIPFLGTRQFYSKSLEWCFNTVLTNFIFTETGNIRASCLDVKNRSALVGALRARLRAAAVFSIALAPFNVGYNCLIYFFKYYTEFTRSPARASTRSFTPYAEWKIREFNELRHLFERRLRQAGPFASEYLKQFPKDKMDQLCRFVAFVSGAIAAVLTLCTLFDPELFLGFEITPGRTAVFYLGLMATIWGVAHGMLPEEHDVHDPVLHLKEVLLYTHYMPAHWKERLHSDEVRAEFSSMYKLKIMIFTEEVLSLIVAPWIMWRNSGRNCERIIDFFREQTVHIEGIGFQCNFAYFNFKKDPNAEDPTALLQEPDGLRDDYYGLKDDKMAASLQNFMQYYSHHNQRPGLRRPQSWQPPPAWPGGIPGIAEEPDAFTTPAQARARPGSTKRSGYIDRHASPSMIRSPRQAPTTSRLRPPQELDERRSKRTMEKSPMPAVSESRLMAQDSDLQDFADAPGAAPLESDSEGDEGDEQGGGGYGGVLGLVSQLARAQTEKATGAAHL
ncbi:hypothetical protein AC579_5333 [Pseudocercospora musae]|uniref:Autophagy-related protein 9 n=1 Tax=Pseudocercospora musae TaxID=113226 RepID=A0A139ITF5_9PEZI|nr:hypothetical protein AC579_5333 [Pseudocercospora musae]